MSRVRFWVAISVVALVAGALGLSGVMAQRFQPMAMPVIPFGEVGRYQVVSHGADGIILLDTTNGELYRAKPEDVKPYSARPRPPRDIPLELDNRRGGPRTDKDKDGRPDTDKDREKKDVDRKDEKKSDVQPDFEQRKDGPPKDKDGRRFEKEKDEKKKAEDDLASAVREKAIADAKAALAKAEDAWAAAQKTPAGEGELKRKARQDQMDRAKKAVDDAIAALRKAEENAKK
jgi:hypothetical protein